VKLGSVNKQPGETESYTVSYEDALTTGDNLVSTSVTSTPSGLTIAAPFVVSPRVRMFISGGTDGVSYKIEVTTVTADGRVLEDEFTVKVKEL
jgi:hypothetical protein